MRLWFMLLAATLTFAHAAPRFVGPTRIYDGSNPLVVSLYGAPCVYDWNGDGRKDMIIGQFTGGYIRFYPNVGTDAAPLFNGFSYQRASGAQITLPSG